MAFEGLIDCLDTEKWQEIKPHEKEGDWEEFFINSMHKQVDATTVSYAIENDSCDAKKVVLEFSKKDPLKNARKCEFRLNEDKTKITGLDLDDDVVVLK